VSRRLGSEIAREITMKVKRDTFMRKRAREEAEEIRDFTRSRTPAPASGPGVHADCKHEAPYATGDTRESIDLERRRERFGLPHWWLGSRSPIINLLEYGTGPDAPGGHANWISQSGERVFSANTPTPEFGMFAQTAMRYGGTVD
jgi:hypothetical protein